MFKKIFLSLFSLLLILTSIVPVQAQDENIFHLDSSYAVIMDATTKRVLYSYNGNEKHYPASITKVMTMLLGVESGNLEREVTISSYGALSIEVGSSHISLMPGETIKMREAILAASLVSANDGANLIAEGVSGDIDTFVQLMNQRAKEIGCTNTHFVNPHGLHDEDHYTTAVDMAKIMSEAVMNETYLQLTNMDEYVIEPTNKTSVPRYLYGQNKCMYSESEYYIPEVMSAKLGYTDQSLNTYVAYGKKGDVHLVVCLMEVANGQGLYTDLQTLFEYGFDTYSAYTHLNDQLKIPTLDHSLFTTGGTLTLSKPFNPPVCNEEEKADYKFTYKIDEEKAKNAKKGDTVGQVHLTYKNEIVSSRDLIVEEPLNNVLGSIFKVIFNIIKIIIILIILAIALLLISKKIYTKYKNAQIRKRRQQRRRQ